NAEGDRQAQILRAQADREAAILRSQGEGQAIQTVFQAIHDGRPDQSLLAYQYLQMMPKIAEGDANKVWIVPSEIGKALEGLGSTMNSLKGIPDEVDGPVRRVDMGTPPPSVEDLDVDGLGDVSSAHDEVAAAIAAAQQASNPGSARKAGEAAAEAAESGEFDESGADPAVESADPSDEGGNAPPT